MPAEFKFDFIASLIPININPRSVASTKVLDLDQFVSVLIQIKGLLETAKTKKETKATTETEKKNTPGIGQGLLKTPRKPETAAGMDVNTEAQMTGFFSAIELAEKLQCWYQRCWCLVDLYVAKTNIPEVMQRLWYCADSDLLRMKKIKTGSKDCMKVIVVERAVVPNTGSGNSGNATGCEKAVGDEETRAAGSDGRDLSIPKPPTWSLEHYDKFERFRRDLFTPVFSADPEKVKSVKEKNSVSVETLRSECRVVNAAGCEDAGRGSLPVFFRARVKTSIEKRSGSAETLEKRLESNPEKSKPTVLLKVHADRNSVAFQREVRVLRKLVERSEAENVALADFCFLDGDKKKKRSSSLSAERLTNRDNDATNDNTVSQTAASSVASYLQFPLAIAANGNLHQFVSTQGFFDIVQAGTTKKSKSFESQQCTAFSPAIFQHARVELVGICQGIASGLQHVHSFGIVHRHVRLQSILLDEKLVPRITDFEFAIFEGETEPDRGDGTLLSICDKLFRMPHQYLAPEILEALESEVANQGTNFDSNIPWTVSSDWYSFGVLVANCFWFAPHCLEDTYDFSSFPYNKNGRKAISDSLMADIVARNTKLLIYGGNGTNTNSGSFPSKQSQDSSEPTENSSTLPPLLRLDPRTELMISELIFSLTAKSPIQRVGSILKSGNSSDPSGVLSVFEDTASCSFTNSKISELPSQKFHPQGALCSSQSVGDSANSMAIVRSGGASGASGDTKVDVSGAPGNDDILADNSWDAEERKQFENSLQDQLFGVHGTGNNSPSRKSKQSSVAYASKSGNIVSARFVPTAGQLPQLLSVDRYGGGHLCVQEKMTMNLFHLLAEWRENSRFVCSRDQLHFKRNSVFSQLLASEIYAWPEGVLLGEWRTSLEGEEGVDGGGLRREIFHLFFEQMHTGVFFRSGNKKSQKVDRKLSEVEGKAWNSKDARTECRILVEVSAFEKLLSESKDGDADDAGENADGIIEFEADGEADSDAVQEHSSHSAAKNPRRPEVFNFADEIYVLPKKCELLRGKGDSANEAEIKDWTKHWVTIGLMSLRCLIHCHSLSLSLSGLCWAAIFGEVPRLPPDDLSRGDAGSNAHTDQISRFSELRKMRGDAWGCKLLYFLLFQLHDRKKAESYRWIISAIEYYTVESSLFVAGSQNVKDSSSGHKRESGGANSTHYFGKRKNVIQSKYRGNQALMSCIDAEIAEDVVFDMWDRRVVQYFLNCAEEIQVEKGGRETSNGTDSGKVQATPSPDGSPTSSRSSSRGGGTAADRNNHRYFRFPARTLEWCILWDIYLKYVGDSVYRWDAYEGFYTGFTLFRQRKQIFSLFNNSSIEFLNALEMNLGRGGGEQFAGYLVQRVGNEGEITLDCSNGVGGDADNAISTTVPNSAKQHQQATKKLREQILSNIEYKPEYGYGAQTDFFKRTLKEFSLNELKRFLIFAVSMENLPASGKFPNNQKISVRFLPLEADILPVAHTCFFALDVPQYQTFDEMRQKLRKAVELGATMPFAIS